jgi:hypothetical protein
MNTNERSEMTTRTILIHLNVTLPEGREDVGPDEVADAILSAVEVASDDERIGYTLGRFGEGELASGNGSPFVVALAEEI